MIRTTFLWSWLILAAVAGAQNTQAEPSPLSDAVSAKLICPCDCNLNLASCQTDQPACTVRAPILKKLENLVRKETPEADIITALQSHEVSPAHKALSRARREHLYQVLFFQEEGSDASDGMAKVIDQAQQAFQDRARVIRVNINDLEGMELAREHRVWKAPTVLIFAPNGVITAGFSRPTTVKEINQAFVSPKTVEIIGAMQQHKVVFLMIQNDQTAHASENLKTARDVADILKTSSVVVQADPVDTEEKQLLGQLAVKSDTKDSVTVVISPSGRIADRFEGQITNKQLLTSFRKVLAEKSGCGSGCGG